MPYGLPAPAQAEAAAAAAGFFALALAFLRFKCARRLFRFSILLYCLLISVLALKKLLRHYADSIRRIQSQSGSRPGEIFLLFCRDALCHGRPLRLQICG